MRFSRILMLAALGGAMGLNAPAMAETSFPTRLTQLFNRPTPPADLDDDGPAQRGPDNGALLIRIERLENQLRSMTGQIEQLQFQVRRLEEQARAGAPGAAAVPPVAAAPVASAPAVPPGAPSVIAPMQPAVAPPAGDPARRRRGDAFDPANDPNAPGAPRQLGSTPASAPLPATPAGPLASRPASTAPGGPLQPPMQPMDLGQPRPSVDASNQPTLGAQPNLGGQPPAAAQPGGATIATAQPMGPKEEYDLAAAYLKQGQYDAAEKGFSAFISKNPKNRLAADAVFGLGESYFQRNRHREAAEQYLKISTSYSNSPRGAEALLRLGESLNALGAKEQACASFAEVSRKYPSASTTIRAADREAKRLQC